MPAYVAVLIAAALIAAPPNAGATRMASGDVGRGDPPILRGIASWYATGPQGPGHAAADKRLQRWLGKGWRGSIVNVCNLSRTVCVRVEVDDTCGCPGQRVIDLHPEDFDIVSDPTLGLTDVVVVR